MRTEAPSDPTFLSAPPTPMPAAPPTSIPDAAPPGTTARVLPLPAPTPPAAPRPVRRETIAPAAPVWSTAVLGGLAGALAGAMLWAAIAVITDLEVGYVAVLVGALTGIGVRFGARAPAPGLQVLAAALALAGLVAAKYAIVAWVVSRELGMSPFDPAIARMFGDLFGELLSPFDALWAFLAIGAAYRVPAAHRDV
jgi:hypothetical protein